MQSTPSIMQYESTIWATADKLYASGIKMSDAPSLMMPFFALVMVESRLLRMLDEFKADVGPETFASLGKADRVTLLKDKGQGYNTYLFEKGKTLADICRNDKSFEGDFASYLKGFDQETQGLLGVDPSDGEKYLNIRGAVSTLKAKKILFGYTREWASIDLRGFNNSEITTLEEHIKRKWADISAETAGEQYTPDDVIALIAEIVASKIKRNDRLLRIYDCTCGGGNLLFGVEDRINERSKRPTETFGQDWNDALYALARIESRFRIDSRIEHGNTLTNDRFSDREFDVVVANPPYGVSWKEFARDIEHDKTGRFRYLPSVSDGQLLFMQHLISKMAPAGMGVVVHNGSTLFSGDAGAAESNIRKWMLDADLVEAIIQLPTDEFFNTGIYTYLWVLNKAKAPERKGKLMLIDASEKFSPLKKSKGSKRKEIDEAHRLEIVDTLRVWEDNDYARAFPRERFYYNKQAILLTNVDRAGKALPEAIKVEPTSFTIDGTVYESLELTDFDPAAYGSLEELYQKVWNKWPSSIDWREQEIELRCAEGSYRYDREKETLILADARGGRTELGRGAVRFKTAFKKAGKKTGERIVISVVLEPDTEKDYEIVPFHADARANRAAIAAFMARYVTRPFEYLENSVGVEINFNKVFYKPEALRSVDEILADLRATESELAKLERGFKL